MKAFEELKSEWENQSRPKVPTDGAKRIVQKMAYIKKGQRITNAVLGLTALILIGFFFCVSAYKNQTVLWGLLLMLGALAVRIGIEVSSLRKLRRMDVLTGIARFKRQMLIYYRNREKVHFIATPLSILVYCIGFVMLLPAFKASLSSGFYTYIVVSSIVLLIVLGLFIAREVRKERAILKGLKGE